MLPIQGSKCIRILPIVLELFGFSQPAILVSQLNGQLVSRAKDCLFYPRSFFLGLSRPLSVSPGFLGIIWRLCGSLRFSGYLWGSLGFFWEPLGLFGLQSASQPASHPARKNATRACQKPKLLPTVC